MEPTLLHGTLHVTIFKKDEQKTTGSNNGLLTRANQLWETVSKASKFDLVTIDLDKARVGSFTVGLDETVHHVYCAHMASKIIFTAYDQQLLRNILKGTVHVPVDEDILAGKEINKLLTFKAPNILVKLQFFLVTDPGRGGDEFGGVVNTYFPQKERCKVSLYQDAHVPLNYFPYRHERCWKGIFDAINDAKHIIYIEGWSLHPDITLVRDEDGKDKKLGELLRKKAEEEGVTVLILIWNDLTTRMHTRSRETVEYFGRSTKVHCVACPDPFGIRNLPNRYIYSHHQKTVVVDVQSPSGGDKREIVAFVGGIDLCGGRYDTPHHPLFSTLNSLHKDDFYQPNFPKSTIKNGGPRQPWHDIHARVGGSVVWDVLRNFEQRWQIQGDKRVSLRNLLDRDIIQESEYSQLSEKDNEWWNVQLFRSGDGRHFGLPNNNYDRSIQDAYINAIRHAKRFIYIENQYFIGSSFAWATNDGGINPAEFGALNLIPKELSLKIVSKIKAKERFTVYVVIPMWPEGEPEGDLVQATLDLQRRTMQMMYKDVFEALNAEGIEEDPRNYLTFFCLGNREVKGPTKQQLTRSNKRKREHKQSNNQLAQETRRFMIYVHSKMMIVDDEYIMIGSSNINQRSMDGARDTEVVIGGYQPNHLARGQIHGFRKSLWLEHLGKLEPCFDNPETKQCVEEVNRLAEINWKQYCQDEPVNLRGHLLRYPLHISKEDGTITTLKGHDCFPDTKAPVLGKLNTNWLLPLPAQIRNNIIGSQIWSIII